MHFSRLELDALKGICAGTISIRLECKRASSSDVSLITAAMQKRIGCRASDADTALTCRAVLPDLISE